MAITEKQKKTYLIVGGAVAFIYFAPSVITWVYTLPQRIAAQRYASEHPRKPVVRKATTPIVKPGVPVPPAEGGPLFPRFGNLTGNWSGQTALKSRGICVVSMQITETKGQFLSYTNTSCSPLGIRQPPANPTLAVMSGMAEKESVNFKVDKVIGTSIDVRKCLVSSFVLTPFGPTGLAAEWEDSCGNGQVMLRRGK